MNPQTQEHWLWRLVEFLGQGSVLFVLAYVSAGASLGSYLLLNGGTGDPTRLELVLLLVPLVLLWRLSLRSAWG